MDALNLYSPGERGEFDTSLLQAGFSPYFMRKLACMSVIYINLLEECKRVSLELHFKIISNPITRANSHNCLNGLIFQTICN